MSIKLVAIDIDGTLLNSQHAITPAVYEAIQEAKAAGVKIVIATGRPISGIRGILEQLHLTEMGDYVITFNGGLVLEVGSDKEILKETLSYEDYLRIEALARRLQLPMHASTQQGIYTANRDIGKYTLYEANLVHSPLYYRRIEEMQDKEIIKVMLVDEAEQLDKAMPILQEELGETFYTAKSAPFYFEVTPKTVNKGRAIQHLAAALGLDMNETMAIGDQENDRSMLEVVASPVIMENGDPNLKAIAKHITKSNDEDGVAYAIRKWVLN